MPLAKGLLAEKDIFGELGEVIVGKKRARTRDSDITVFDSTGLAIQDVATANMVYRKAVAGEIGIKLQQF